jgi:hypothetical protein
MRACFQSMAFALLMVLAFSLQSSYAQTTITTPANDTVTEKETLELRAFTKDFLARLRKTRDVRPLLTRYFADDFETFSYLFASDEDPTLKAPMSRSERKRIVLAGLNFMYVVAPYMIIGPVDDFSKRIPASLRRRFLRVLDSLDSIEKRRFKRQSIFRFIQQVEPLTDDLRRYSARKKIESSKAYQAAVQKRQNLDDYNFRILADSPDPDSDKPAARWIRQRGPDTRTFTVGTPYGIAVFIIRTKNQYRVLLLWPWPISYDGRVN